MPTPGVAPREDARYADIRRRALDPRREPLPTRVEDVPELPSVALRALDAGLLALDLGLTPDARLAIEGHARLLLAWTTSINLTAIRDPEAVATAHIVDSLTAVEVLAARGIGRFLDLGSGGGYPGLPLAAALPAERVLLVDPTAKKIRFLETVIEATGLTATVEAAAVRSEALAADGRHRGRWPAVTARAVAPLAELIELSFPLLAPDGVLVAWKRGDLADEVAAARRAMAGLGGGTLEGEPVLVPGLDGHVLVVVTRRGRVPDAYPRDPGARRRRPW
jgi:16S rRNA (guanine527-N7)-methyltransferase